VAEARTYRARCFALEVNLVKVDEEIKLAKTAQDRDSDLIYHQAESYYLLGERAKDPDRAAAFQRGRDRLNWYTQLKGNERDPKGWFLMGLCYLRLGGKRDNFDQAIDRFAKAQRFGMKDQPDLFSAWAEAYVGLGDSIRAGQKYRESFDVHPTEEACLHSATCFLQANSKISAEKILREGLQRFPKSQRLLQLLSQITR